MRQWLAAVLAAWLLGGCGVNYGPGDLKAGDSIAAVRARMGPATEESQSPDGGRVWWFVRGPLGLHTYRVEFDQVEQVRSIAQVLTEENFRKILAGQSTGDDVLALIGRPREEMRFPRLDETVWTWRYKDGTFNKYLHVYLGPDRVVRRIVLEHETTSP